MGRMIFVVSFLFVVASIFVISLALYYPGLSNSPANSAPVAPQSGSILVAPQVMSTLPTPVQPQAMSVTPEEKVMSESPAPLAPSSPESTMQAATTNTVEPMVERQNTNINGIAEQKTEEELKKRNEVKKTPKPQDPNGMSETVLVLGGKVFRPGQVELSQSAIESIGNIVPLLKERSGAAVLVEGHSDSYSSASDSAIAAEENRKVSVMRAQEVARIFEQQGIPVDRIVVRGYGDTRPVKSNATHGGRSQNRRVEIKFIPLLDRQ
jgi:outer membrane protein OmpA-like peptidoglycan-associated protein